MRPGLPRPHKLPGVFHDDEVERWAPIKSSPGWAGNRRFLPTPADGCLRWCRRRCDGPPIVRVTAVVGLSQLAFSDKPGEIIHVP
jgi:hypothetical protein